MAPPADGAGPQRTTPCTLDLAPIASSPELVAQAVSAIRIDNAAAATTRRTRTPQIGGGPGRTADLADTALSSPTRETLASSRDHASSVAAGAPLHIDPGWSVARTTGGAVRRRTPRPTDRSTVGREVFLARSSVGIIPWADTEKAIAG